MALNRFQDRVIVSRMAVAGQDGAASFFRYVSGQDPSLRFPGQSGILFSMVPGDGFVQPSGPEIQTVSLDQWMLAHPGVKVDLVKMDTEGAEWSILHNASAFLRGMEEVLLFIEVHPNELNRLGASPAALREVLVQAGFTVHAVRETAGGVRLQEWLAGMPFQGFYHILCSRDPGRMPQDWVIPG